MTDRPTIPAAYQVHPNPPHEPLAGWACSTIIVSGVIAWLFLIGMALVIALGWWLS